LEEQIITITKTWVCQNDTIIITSDKDIGNAQSSSPSKTQTEIQIPCNDVGSKARQINPNTQQCLRGAHDLAPSKLTRRAIKRWKMQFQL
jgi:hypothetical protein